MSDTEHSATTSVADHSRRVVRAAHRRAVAMAVGLHSGNKLPFSLRGHFHLQGLVASATTRVFPGVTGGR